MQRSLSLFFQPVPVVDVEVADVEVEVVDVVAVDAAEVDVAEVDVAAVGNFDTVHYHYFKLLCFDSLLSTPCR